MFKFLIISCLIGYLLFKLIGVVFKFLLRGSTSGHHNQSSGQNHYSQRKPSEGNVNIDYVPNHEKRKDKDFKGGEYVDYEEVK